MIFFWGGGLKLDIDNTFGEANYIGNDTLGLTMNRLSMENISITVCYSNKEKSIFLFC